MAQRGFDILREVTDSRYRLSLVVGRRAAQLTKGVPSTLTGKPVPGTQNAVSEAMKELELGSGVLWGDALPGSRDIHSNVEQDQHELQRETAQFSIIREEQAERDSADLMDRRNLAHC